MSPFLLSILLPLTSGCSRKEQQLDFRAMDEFMDDLIAAINDHGARAVRIFPPASHVVLYFSERIANEVVGTFSC